MSKLILFDFECVEPHCAHVFEELVDSNVKIIPCAKCGTTAVRQIGAVRLDWRRMGVDPDFATCSDKWAKMQEQKARVKEEGYNLTHY